MAWSLAWLYLLHVVHAQSISTVTPLPPLQWINLSNLLQGSAPPPLKDAAIGYDETSRSIIIFGGESESGFAQSQTYLLNLDTLTWSRPSPPSNLQRTPPSRSASVAGCDFAASNRRGFVVIGGKGSDGKALSDIWEYDFNNQFWSQVGVSPGGPSARWGAAGGIDNLFPPIQDPVLPGPNNTFYLAGGFDGTISSPLSDVWRFNISGTLSSNLPNDTLGSWDQFEIGNLPSKTDQAGVVISRRIIAAGGCNTAMANVNCPQPDSYIIDTQRRSAMSPGACPAPRLSPVIVPNANTFSSTFASQAFLLFGIFNSSLWQDDGGLDKGEVAVLDINTGSWSRVLPSGDPGTSGIPTFPGPREGAAALSYPSSLVGGPRTISSDTIVFGGRDSSGTYLSEIWLLRGYSGTITPSEPTWSGFGDGQLQTGVNASGTGVRIDYMTKCASAISLPNTTASPTSSFPGTPTNPPITATSTSSLPIQIFNSSLLHKLFAPLSIALLLPVFVSFRLLSPKMFKSDSRGAWFYITVIVATAAYGIGVAGLATAFTTASTSTSFTKRSSDSNLTTNHGKAALALFICLYGMVPLLAIISACFNRTLPVHTNENNEKSCANMSESLPMPGPPTSVSQSVNDASPPSSPRPRTHSWGPSSMWHRSREGRMSSDGESMSSGGMRGFEVNRPPRGRQLSESWLTVPEVSSHYMNSSNLRDVDWLQRRRSLNAVGELDYAITQAHRAKRTSTPGTTDALVTPVDIPKLQNSYLAWPRASLIVLHMVTQASLLGLCVVCLIALWSQAPRFAFALFLAWTTVFYVAMTALAWRGRPTNSILAVIFSRVRTDYRNESGLPLSPSPLPSEQRFPFPIQSPYVHHHPPYRAATAFDYSAPEALTSEETDALDDDEDEDTRQTRIEEEMGRRDVSIITIPKRKLRIANPS